MTPMKKDVDSTTFATEFLRHLLDERGVEYETCDKPSMWYTCWRLAGDNMMNACFEEIDGLVPSFYIRYATPEQAIAATLGPTITGETSDGYHTFNELYNHRAVLFSVIVRDHVDLAWKSKAHNDGSMYDGMFIVGIETPYGQATYHYDIDPYWDMFDCKELERAPEWDGHTPDDAIARIATLGAGTCTVTPECKCSACDYQYPCTNERSYVTCDGRTAHYATYTMHNLCGRVNFCPNCGKRVI